MESLWLNFQPDHSAGAHGFTRGPGHFLALLAAGVRLSLSLSLSFIFFLSSSQLLSVVTPETRIFFLSFSSSICDAETRRRLLHLSNYFNTRPPIRDRKRYQVLRLLRYDVLDMPFRRLLLPLYRTAFKCTLPHKSRNFSWFRLWTIHVIFAIFSFVGYRWILKLFIFLFLLNYLMTSDRKKHARSSISSRQSLHLFTDRHE